MQDRTGWLAAYALGLAYTERPDADCARSLELAAEHDPQLLSSGRSALTSLRLPSTRETERAGRLLDEALRAVADRDLPLPVHDVHGLRDERRRQR